MKIIDAVWEKKNIGVKTCEIEVERGDTMEAVLASVDDTEYEYIVVKLPADMNDFIFELQKHGMMYVEDIVLFVHYLNKGSDNPVFARLLNEVRTELMTEQDIADLKKHIEGGLFSTDRIAIDPFFEKGLAAQRYINWVSDEYSRGTEYYKYIYKDKVIGFFALRETENGHYTSFLGGIYPEYRKGGIGAIVRVPDVVREKGGKKVSTSVSTNNPAQIRNLISCGYVPEGITHTFIKHQRGGVL